MGAQFHWYDGPDRIPARITAIDYSTSPPTLIFTAEGSRHLVFPGGILLTYRNPSTQHPEQLLGRKGV